MEMAARFLPCPKSCNFQRRTSSKQCGTTLFVVVWLLCTKPGTFPRSHEVSGDLGFPSRRGPGQSLLPGTPSSGTLHCHLLQSEMILTPAIFQRPHLHFSKGQSQEALGTTQSPLCSEACKYSHSVLQDPSVQGGSGTFIDCLEHSQAGLRSGQQC